MMTRIIPVYNKYPYKIRLRGACEYMSVDSVLSQFCAFHHISHLESEAKYNPWHIWPLEWKHNYKNLAGGVEGI
jgi:hypothetical protein